VFGAGVFFEQAFEGAGVGEVEAMQFEVVDFFELGPAPVLEADIVGVVEVVEAGYGAALCV